MSVDQYESLHKVIQQMRDENRAFQERLENRMHDEMDEMRLRIEGLEKSVRNLRDRHWRNR